MQDYHDFQGSLNAFEEYMNKLGDNPTAENQAKAKENITEILSQILIFFRYMCIDENDNREMRLPLLESIKNRIHNIKHQYYKILFRGMTALTKLCDVTMRFIPTDYNLTAEQINATMSHTEMLKITQCIVTNEGGGTIEIKLDLILENYNFYFENEVELIRQDYDFISQHQNTFKDLDIFMMQEVLLKQRGLEQVHRCIAYSLSVELYHIHAAIRNMIATGDYYFKFNIETSLIPPQNFILFRPEVTLEMLRTFEIWMKEKKFPNEIFYKILQEHFLTTADDLTFFRKKIDRHMDIQ